MREVQDRLRFLLNQYANQTSSAEEEREFFTLINDADQNAQFRILLKEMMEQQETFVDLDKERWEPILQKVFDSEKENVFPLHAKNKSTGWVRWVAAAVVFAIILSAAWFIVSNIKTEKPGEIATQEQRFKNDIRPGTNVPQLILADGRTVHLDSTMTGSLALEGTVKITRLDNGEVTYSATGNPSHPRYNTMINPRGSRVLPLTLADGTKVWLDAASSITFPTAFVGNERKVEITGQAYFEVAHNARMPFRVKKSNDDAEIQVLGTHFNIMAFDDEEIIKVTLIEGSVKVSKGINNNIIKPGEQAQVDKNASSIRVVRDADIDQTMAWKNGNFKFNDITIEPLMKQLARWYDVEVVFQDKPTEHFVSTIPRDVSASQVFKILETTGRVHFKIDGKKVTVMK